MAFLNNNGLDVFLEIPVEPASKMFRPLAKEPKQIWGHGFPTPETAVQLPTGQGALLRLRDYHFEVCTATDKRGTGCLSCTTVDPAWGILTAKDQTNKKGHRVDFPKRPIYLLPVWDYTTNTVKILRGGNQVYENMDKWDTEGRDIRDCDWKVWKTGQAKTTKYHTSRQDSSTFTVQVDKTMLDAAWGDALKEYLPTPPDKLIQMMAIMTVAEATQKYMESQRTAPIAGAPALPPGGFQGQAALPAAPATPAVDMSQLAAQLADVQRQLAEAKAKAAATVSPAPAQGGQSDIPFDQKAAAPAAAVVAPVAAPAVPADPKDMVLDGGKYIGSTVAQVLEKDPEYLKFYRAYIKDATVKAFIDAALAAKPAVPAPAPVAAPATPAAPGASAEAAPDRQALVAEIRTLIDTFPEFKGRGLGDNLVPFLKSVLGRYDYTESNVNDLLRLKTALMARKAPAVAA